nr:prolyl-tRNA synthetase associated domain-containing protein [Pelagibacteraceae bacterium]
MLNSDQFIDLLKEKKYNFEIFKHNALFTVEDSNKLRGVIKGSHSKNLFLKNKKNNFYLFSCEEYDQINLKSISKSLNLGNLSFAKEEHLNQYLGIKPGSVSPFSLLNDQKNNVVFYFEKTLYESELINFHPLINTLTITMNTMKFIDFMIENKKKIHIFSSVEGKILKTYG